MNARGYRVRINDSPLDRPPIMGLGESSLSWRSEEPQIINNKVLLSITKKYILLDVNNNKEHEVLTVQSIYEIPIHEIKSKEDVYEFFKDATLSLNETYQYHKTQLPDLHNILLSTPPVQYYQREIDRVFDLLSRRN